MVAKDIDMYAVISLRSYIYTRHHTFGTKLLNFLNTHAMMLTTNATSIEK